MPDATALIATHYRTGDTVELRVLDGKLTALESRGEAETDLIVAPGFVDLQVNGYGGVDFTSDKLTVEDVVQISLGLDRHGVTGYLPTLTTNSAAVFEHALATIDLACRELPQAARRILGVHVEGPYICPLDGPRGAHPRQHCRPPDWNEFARWQQAAGGRIKLLTLSPEYEESPAFIRRAVDSGVLIAIGHTNANTEQIAAAVDAGARMSTHLGNGAHPLIRRHPNYIWDQLADDRLTASIIADGHHLPPNVIQSFVRAKLPQRIVLVSDMTGMGGMPPGRYSTMLGEVEVLDNGKLVVAGQRDILAGAALPIDACVANMLAWGYPLAEVVEMASVRPAALLGREHGLSIHAPANAVLLRRATSGRYEVAATINGGEFVFSDFGFGVT